MVACSRSFSDFGSELPIERERPLSRTFQTLVLAVVIAAATLGLGRESNAGGPVAIGTGANSGSATSTVAGAHAGYNWQSGPAVFGFETDLSGAANLKTSLQGPLVSPFSGILPAPAHTNTTATIDWYGTLRGRLGVTNGPVLFYGTAGLAYGHVDLSSTVQTSVGAPLNSQTSGVRTGWVAGAGIEYMYRPDLVFTLGYQYVDLGTISLTGTLLTAGRLLSQSASTHAQFQTVMAGFSWKFPPTGSGPWQGGYGGVQAGGAWGLPTNATYSSQ
jgi:outer membrane immunogenic protein